MVSKVTSLDTLAMHGLRAVAKQAAPKRDEAPAAAGARLPAPVHAKHEGRPVLAPRALSVLIDLQIEGNVSNRGVQTEIQRGRGDRDDHPRRDRADEHRNHDNNGRWGDWRGNGKPKKPHPHDPPPAPTPAPTPAPAPVVVDSPEPVRFLERVREQLHTKPESRFPDAPFSQRDKPAVPAAQTPQGLSAFYTPGAFTPAQASAMRTVAQGQAGLALLQAAQMSQYSAAGFGLRPLGLDRLV